MQFRGTYHVTTIDELGERWTVSSDEPHVAVCELAGQIDVDLRDGQATRHGRGRAVYKTPANL